MSDVQFEQEQELSSFQSRKILGDPTTPKLYALLEKSGIVKNARQAHIVSIITICLFVLLTIFICIHFVFRLGTTPSAPELKISNGIVSFEARTQH